MKTRTTRSDTRLRAAGTVGHFGSILVAGVWGFMTMPTASAQTAPPTAPAADIQLPAPIPAPPPANTEAGTAEADRVIVTGSNIPTAEEVGPNPVDTYRREDIQKLGVYNGTDLLTKLPQEMGSTVNQNIANGGDGSVIPNLRGLLPKETLVLIDGKRAAIIGSGGGNGNPGTAGVDINLIPFPMIDHIDILKDGASAIYGSDAVAGVGLQFETGYVLFMEIVGTPNC